MKRSINRLRTTGPSLKHLAFFEVLGNAAEETPSGRAATAGLLTLRLVDHWVLVGSAIVEPESVSVRSVRAAIMAVAANDPQRDVLLGVINTIQTLREVDVQPVLPRLFAYAGLLEKRGALSLAADVYSTVVRLADASYDGDLVIDCYMRLAYCERTSGHLAEADTAYATAGKLAKRMGEPARVLQSRIGAAKVTMQRGNLPAADELLGTIVDECASLGFPQIHAMALHDQAAVAMRRGDHVRAVCLAYDALERTIAPSERERVLNDIAATFVAMGRFDEARTALLISEATSVAAESRRFAQVNLLSLAVRVSDERLFLSYRASLQAVALPPELRANYLIECARGVRQFGSPGDAASLLEEARSIAAEHGLNRALFEVDEVLAEAALPATATSGGNPVMEPDPAAHVAHGLKELLSSIAA